METGKTLLNVEGMTCSNCALGVSRFLEKKGLQDVRVDFTSGEVTFDEVGGDRIPEIIEGIQQLGYRVVDNAESFMYYESESGCSSFL